MKVILNPNLLLAMLLIWTTGYGADDDENLVRVDLFFSNHLAHIQSPGFAVAIYDRSGKVFSKGYGVEVIDQPKPMTAQSIMAIGSLTKSFTAMAVLQLEEKGLLSVDDRIIDHLPWFRAADKSLSDTITIRMCLNNTTGLTPSFNILTRNLTRSPDALEKGVRAISSYKFTRKPGESYEYFNEGWDVAGLIIEKVTGMRYEHYIAQNILEPLDMHRSSTDRAVLETMPVLTGHYGGIKPVPADFIHVQGALPAGSGLYSTVEDLGQYLMTLMNGGVYDEKRVLTDASIAKMWSPGIQMHLLPYELGGTGEPSQYAMGYFLFDIDGTRYVGHGGEFRTMSSFGLIDRDHDLAIALLYNTGSLYPYTNERHYYAMISGLRALRGLPPSDFGVPREADPTLNDYQPGEDQVEPLAGTYLSDGGRRLDLRPGGSEGLQAFLTDGIYPADFDVDFVNSTNVILRNIMEANPGTFVTDAAGRISSIRYQGEIFRRKSQARTDALRLYHSQDGSLSFGLPKDWELDWLESGFQAHQGKIHLSGVSTELSFEEWSSQYGGGQIALGEMRNGYFFQSVMARRGSGTVSRQVMAMHCSHRGRNYVFTLETPDGELTYAVIAALNPFLDSLALN